MTDYRESGRTLEDVQTRYKTFQELREVWQLGVEACNRILPQYRSKADAILLGSLEAAIELLDHQIDLMSQFDMKKFQTGRLIDGIPKAENIPDTDREIEQRQRRQKESPALPNGDATTGQSDSG